MGQQAQRDVAMPALPGARFGLIQPDHLGLLDAFLDSPARPRHLRQVRHGALLIRIALVVSGFCCARGCYSSDHRILRYQHR